MSSPLPRPGDGPRARRETANKQSRILALICAAIAVAMIAAAAAVGGHVSTPTGGAGPQTSAPDPQIDTNPALLASTAGQVNGESVDGIEALGREQLLFHIHAHLAIYVNG